jgi:hypothetical protein
MGGSHVIRVKVTGWVKGGLNRRRLMLLEAEMNADEDGNVRVRMHQGQPCLCQDQKQHDQQAPGIAPTAFGAQRLWAKRGQDSGTREAKGAKAKFRIIDRQSGCPIAFA